MFGVQHEVQQGNPFGSIKGHLANKGPGVKLSLSLLRGYINPANGAPLQGRQLVQHKLEAGAAAGNNSNTAQLVCHALRLLPSFAVAR